MNTHLVTAMQSLIAGRVELLRHSGELQDQLQETEAQLELVDTAISKLEDMGIVGQMMAEYAEYAETPVIHALAAAEAKPKAKRQGRTPGSKANAPNYAEIAKTIISLLREHPGAAISPALSAHYGVPKSTTQNWMARCRKLGLIPTDIDPHPNPTAHDATATVTSMRPDEPIDQGTLLEIDIRVFVSEYLELRRAGKRPLNELAARYLCDRRAVQERIAAARDMALLPPRDEPQLPADERAELLAAIPARTTIPKGTKP